MVKGAPSPPLRMYANNMYIFYNKVFVQFVGIYVGIQFD